MTAQPALPGLEPAPSRPRPALAAIIDGQTYPLDKCDWVLCEPCGCPVGVCIARYAPTEEQAWKRFYDYSRDRTKAQKRGMTVDLIPHERYGPDVMPKLMTGYECPHGGAS